MVTKGEHKRHKITKPYRKNKWIECGADSGHLKYEYIFCKTCDMEIEVGGPFLP